MILRHDRTIFREDCGIWLRREAWPRRPKRWQPFINGTNHKGDRWLADRFYLNQIKSEVYDRAFRLWIRTHKTRTAQLAAEQRLQEDK